MAICTANGFVSPARGKPVHPAAKMVQVTKFCIAKPLLCAVLVNVLVLTVLYRLLTSDGPVSLVPVAVLPSDRQRAAKDELLPRVETEAVDRADGDTKDVQGRGGGVEIRSADTQGEGGPETAAAKKADRLETTDGFETADKGLEKADGLDRADEELNTVDEGGKIADRLRTVDGLQTADEKHINTTTRPGLQQALDPNKRLLLKAFSGRLGNCLFELASAVCIAELNNLTLVIQDSSNLQGVDFQGIRVSDSEWNLLFQTRQVTTVDARLCCIYLPALMKLDPAGHSFKLRGYLHNWRYFEPCKQHVLTAVRFKDKIVRKARAAVTSLRTAHPGKTLVGVHVRLEDYLDDREINNGKVTAPPDYYRKAMTYFRKRYDDVTFVVFTTQVAFFKENVTSSPDVVFQGRSDIPAEDVEILSGLDHLIISVGTFGWWAAYRSRGTVVCYRDFFTPGTKYGKQFANGVQDFLYPTWVPM